jgi:2-dehydropantoate 2-reductase
MLHQVCSSASGLPILTCVPRALPDIVTTPEILGPLLHSSTAFLLIQNGVGIEEDLRRAVPSATILSACAWIFATVVEDGKKMKQTGRVSPYFIHTDMLIILLPQILLDIGTHHKALGSDTRHPEGKTSAQVIADLFRAGGLNVTSTNDIQAARWVKVLW